MADAVTVRIQRIQTTAAVERELLKLSLGQGYMRSPSMAGLWQRSSDCRCTRIGRNMEEKSEDQSRCFK